MTKFLTGLIVAVLTNDQVKALIKSLLQDVVKEDVMPSIPIAAAAAGKAAVDEAVLSVQGLERKATTDLGTLIGTVEGAIASFLPGVNLPK